MTTAFQSNEDLLARLNQNRASSGGGGAWHSLEPGRNVVRFVYDGETLPFVEYWLHRGVRDDGKFQTLPDLGWVFGPKGADVSDRSELTTDDADLVGRHGDPVSQLYEAFTAIHGRKQSDWPDEFKDARNRPVGSRQTLAVALMDDALGYLRLSSTTYDGVLAALAGTPTIMDPEEGYCLNITRSGKGLSTTYNVQILPDSKGPADVEITLNPADAVARDVVGYWDKVAFAKRSYATFIAACPDFAFGGE